jgi:FtsP/CotA-like multicopper oxidase with cupredoxin domain
MSLNPFTSLGMPVAMPEAIDLTYYIAATQPGTYLYHCHVEAAEHMEMGMLGHFVVRPRQDNTSVPYTVVSPATGGTFPKTFTKFAYNDCPAGVTQTDTTLCGSTGYDVEKLIQLGDFDILIHDWDFVYGSPPPNFVLTRSTHFMMNGRGYPDDIITGPAPVVPGDPNPAVPGGILNGITLLQPQPPQGDTANGDYVAQRHDALVTASATAGQSVLIRVTNLSIVNPTSLQSEIPFRVVGKDARMLKGPGADRQFNTADDVNLAYTANNVLIGPGETFDLILDTAGVPTGKYFLYSRNLEHLNNDLQDRGGAMTEIILN